jgi:CubicO group peptidase (beta-lactamase class C family)
VSSIDERSVARLSAHVADQVERGSLRAAQFALALDGDIVATESFGSATPEHRFVIFSATKTITALALLPHLADGSLELTAPVAAYLPEFGENGKEEVSVLHLLTMQGGFPTATLGPRHWGSSRARRERMAEWRLDWQAGSRTEYHPLSAHWVIAELIEALSAEPYTDAVHRQVSAPAGVDRVLTPSPGGPVVEIRVDGETPTTDAQLAAVIAAYGDARLVGQAAVDPDSVISMNDPRSQAACVPGGGGVARAVDVARIYQHVLADDSPWMRDARGVVRNASINVSDRVAANRTIAGVIAGRDGHERIRCFPSAPRSFGHHGMGGQLCWADPDSGLSFCFLHDTVHRDPGVTLLRVEAINRLALACVRS